MQMGNDKGLYNRPSGTHANLSMLCSVRVCQHFLGTHIDLFAFSQNMFVASDIWRIL